MDGMTKAINMVPEIKEPHLIQKIGKAFKSLKWYEIIMCIVLLGISIYYAIQPQEGTPQWLAIINFISGLCGIICVFFCAKANRMNFPFAVVNTTVFMIYLAFFGIWATFWLEAIVYFPMNIISWVNWYKHKDEEDKLLAKSKKLTALQNVLVTAIIIGVTVFVHFVLQFLAGDTSGIQIAGNKGLVGFRLIQNRSCLKSERNAILLDMFSL
jgi:nicotinamide mononucleotide transporter